jgi:hypothetical protein
MKLMIDTFSTEPTCNSPSIDTALLITASLRTDNELPVVNLEATLNEEPSRANAFTDNELPIKPLSKMDTWYPELTNPRIDKELPQLMKSKTDIFAPNLVNCLTVSELPAQIWSITLSLYIEPRRTRPCVDMPEPSRA